MNFKKTEDGRRKTDVSSAVTAKEEDQKYTIKVKEVQIQIYLRQYFPSVSQHHYL